MQHPGGQLLVHEAMAKVEDPKQNRITTAYT